MNNIGQKIDSNVHPKYFRWMLILRMSTVVWIKNHLLTLKRNNNLYTNIKQKYDKPIFCARPSKSLAERI